MLDYSTAFTRLNGSNKMLRGIFKSVFFKRYDDYLKTFLFHIRYMLILIERQRIHYAV